MGNPTPTMMSLRGIRAPSQTMAETGMRNETYGHIQNQNLVPPKIEEPKQETTQPPSISTQKPTQTLSAATSLKKSFNKIGDFLRTKSKEKSLEIKNQSSDLAESQQNNNHSQASTNTNQNLPKSSIPDHHSIQNNNCDVIDEENVFPSVDQLQNSKDVYSHKFYQHQSSSNAPNSANKVQVSSNSSSKLIARRTDIAPHNNNNNNNSNDNHNHNRSTDNGTPTNTPRQMDHYQQHQTQIRERGPQFINAHSQNNQQSNLNSETNLRRADEYPKRRKYDSSAMQFSPLASQNNFHMNSQNSSNRISPHYQNPNQNNNNFSLSPVILSPNQISQVDPRTLTNNVKDSYLAVDDIEIHNEALLEQQQQNQLSHLYQTKTDSLERENKMQNVENTNTVKNNSSNSTGKIDNNQTLENSHSNSSNNKSEKDHQSNQKPEKENKKSKKEKDGTSSTNKYSSK